MHIGIIGSKTARSLRGNDQDAERVRREAGPTERIITMRVLVEVLFYFVVVCTNIPGLTPFGQIKYGLGGIIDAAGLPFIVILAFSRRPFPFSIKMAMLMAVFVNISNWWAGDLPVVGEKSAPYSHWIAWLAMSIWLVRNENCARRMVLFFAMFMIGVTLVGGVSNDNWEHRLHMDAGYGTSFMNSNDIAHISAFFCVASLFLGHPLRARYRVIFWLAAILMIGLVIETVSRGGMAAMGAGLAGFLAWSAGQRVKRNRFFIYLSGLIGIVAMIIYGGIFTDQIEVFIQRLTKETGRSYIYSMDLIPQLMENLGIGSGTETVVRAAGNTAHNTFVYNFICYGGIMAAVYLAWLCGLMRGIWKLVRREGTWGANGGMLAVLFAVGMISQILSNQANMFFSFIFATALIEEFAFGQVDDDLRIARAANAERPGEARTQE